MIDSHSNALVPNECVRQDRNCSTVQFHGSGGNSIQEYTAANPYYPPQKKTVGVRICVSTHAQRSPSVRRHRRPILPNQSRVTARVRSRNRLPHNREIASMSLRHFSKVPVSPFVVSLRARHHPLSALTTARLPCRSVARFPQKTSVARVHRLLLRPLSPSTAFESRD